MPETLHQETEAWDAVVFTDEWSGCDTSGVYKPGIRDLLTMTRQHR